MTQNLDLTSEVGLERLQRAVTLLMIQHVNTAIATQNALWATRDATFFAAAGRTDPNFSCEEIETNHIYSGIIPSLIQAPQSDYPNLCVIAYIATPTSTTDDWMERYSVTLAIEIMVKSLDDEEEVNARIHRTLEAAHSVLISDKMRRIPEGDSGLNLVVQVGNMPLVTISDVFVRHISSDPTARSFYQQGSLTYRIDKFSAY